MQATITKIGDRIEAIVRRNHRAEGLFRTRANAEQLTALKVGDKINVKRETNNPYLIFVEKVVS